VDLCIRTMILDRIKGFQVLSSRFFIYPVDHHYPSLDDPEPLEGKIMFAAGTTNW